MIYSYKTKNGIKYMSKVFVNKKQVLKRGFETMDDAREYEELLFLQVKVVKAPAFQLLIKSYLDRYTQEYKSSSCYTVKKYIDNMIIPYFPNVPIDELNYSHFNNWWKIINKVDTTVEYKRNVLGVLRRIFKHCELFYGFKIPYADMLPSFRDVIHAPNFNEKSKLVSVEDIKKLFSVINKVGDEKTFLLYLIAYETGARIGEIVGLTCNAFDFENGYIFIYQQITYDGHGKSVRETPKSKSSIRRYPISNQLKNRLLKFINDFDIKENNYLFHSKRNKNYPIGKTSLRRTLNSYCEIANLKHISFHNFRTTRATQLSLMGVNVDDIGDYLGHSSGKVTKQYYIKSRDSKKEEIRNLIERSISEVIS